MKQLIILIILFQSAVTIAQKKVTPVNQSAISGMSLPNGSKQDSRFLTEITAKTLLEMETKKAGTTVSKVEVLTLPAESGFSSDSLVAQLSNLGYAIQPLETDNKYAWLQKDSRNLVLYFEKKKTSIELYFGELGAAPTTFQNTIPQQQQQTMPEQQTTTQQINTQQQITTEQQTTTQQTTPEQQQTTTTQQTTSVNTGYAFNTTNFDDGWTSTIQEDWVEVVKGNIKVLLHFPKEGTIFPADPDKLTTAAWNILVAPRYSQLVNYKTAYVETNNRPYFGMGTVTENNSGNSVFVVLFRRSAGWMEVITPDVLTFTQEFGFNPETIRWAKVTDYSGGYVVDNSQGVVIKADEPELYNKLDNMTGRNKFAVAATDLNNTGRWDANFSSNTFYYNYYSGNFAGMSTFSASQWYEFSSGNKYHWEAVMTNSGGGVINAAQSKSDGIFKSLNNWQMSFSNIGGQDKTFDVYFSAIKGGRVLWMNDANHPGSGIFTGLAKRK
ncbi:hypothetical protein WG954_14065 [Lacibacter sp. H375]|uniref:hypothetical protein n=1 Tax=Lacibacter sp. H375 TaxID=3133424 RepID=UPI0030C31D9D